jgi:phosphoglycolate phosphatase
MIDQITGVIWDWNGTLLDDIRLCVAIMNGMLEKRRLPLLSESGYKNVFSFPVSDYYQKIGFDFAEEPFEIPAIEFIARYNEKLLGCGLHEDAMAILKYFQASGIRQFVLSAMHQEVLDECLKHQNISHYFEHVSGLDNHFAASKTENGKALIAELKLDAAQLVLIGDTVHDFDVATALGCRCILIANGHQSKEVLQSTGTLVIDRLSELLEITRFD